MSDKQKILVCGDVNGKFKNVFGRVDSLNKKSGPFDLFLITGRFFESNNDELLPYKRGEKQVSIPTYVLGPCTTSEEKLYPENAGEEILPNVTYLGKRGVYTTSSGMKIAYLSGIQSKDNVENNHTFTANDCTAVRDACLRGKMEYRGVDVLITSEWPANIQNLDERNINLNEGEGSINVSWLATHIKPRYHFVASSQLYYERPPYRNLSKQRDIRELATRFIAIAPVGNDFKEKSMYACSLQPIERVRMTDLLQGTTDETPSPYDSQLLEQHAPGAAKSMGNGQFFYDMNTSDGDQFGKKRKRKDDNQKERKKPEFDKEKCWFCLLSPTVERHLIISVGEHCYLALAKGPLTPFHCLITPVEHHQSVVQLPQEVKDEIDKFKDSLHQLFATMNNVPVFFERNFKTSHLQVQCVPVHTNMKNSLTDEFVDQASANGIKLSLLTPKSELGDIMPPGVPYFHVELPDGSQLYTRTKHNFPLQLGRDILSSEQILDCEDKTDWRSCELSKEQETKYVKDFREKFAPFDFTLED